MSLAQLIVERGAASLADVEASIENQVVFGGDLGTNLVEVGALKENTLHRLLSDYHEMPIGPQGRLPDLAPELDDLITRESMARYRVYPIKRTRRTLHVATARPLDPETERKLQIEAGLQLRALVVTPLRLAEALARSCGLGMRARDHRLVKQLEAGIKPERVRTEQVRSVIPPMFATVAPYRRMAEHPEGILPSSRQPKPRRPEGGEATPPETLDGVGPGPASRSSRPPSSAPPPSARSAAISSAPPASAPASARPISSVPSTPRPSPSEPPTTKQEGKRVTQPYPDEVASSLPPSDGGPDSEIALADADAEGKRDTQPWRDDEPDSMDEPALSLRGEFDRSLSEAPPSDDAKIHEEHRAFRHRGPFTRAQAELAVSQADEVQAVLEILVRYARQFFERTVLLVVQGEQATLRLAHGLGIKLASFRVPLEPPSVMCEAYETGDPVVRPLGADGVDAFIKRELAVGGRRVAVIPLSIRERVVAIFYGDDRDEGVDRDAVADVTDFTEICAQEVTRIIVRRKRGRPG
jgi:hypothetical protein